LRIIHLAATVIELGELEPYLPSEIAAGAVWIDTALVARMRVR